jgi:hypothetical protein
MEIAVPFPLSFFLFLIYGPSSRTKHKMAVLSFFEGRETESLREKSSL